MYCYAEKVKLVDERERERKEHRERLVRASQIEETSLLKHQEVKLKVSNFLQCRIKIFVETSL